MSIRIIGTGSALPEKRITNEMLARMVDTSDEWIRERTGIRSRHVSTGETTASLAAQACRRALEYAGREAGEVELLLTATCSPEEALPCTACQIQDKIGAANAAAFDINAACAGFLFALQTAWAYVEAGVYRNALIVGTEVLSKLVDWQDRSTCILFGDGAGAVLVEKCDRDGVLSFVQHSDGSRGGVLACGSGRQASPFSLGAAAADAGMNSGSGAADSGINAMRSEAGTLGMAADYVRMNGREVFAFAVRQVPAAIEEALKAAALSVEDVDLFVLHQANKRIIEGIAKRLGADISRFPMNLERVGNTSSAAIPILLDELNRQKRIEKGQVIVLSGFGAGLTYGACVLRV